MIKMKILYLRLLTIIALVPFNASANNAELDLDIAISDFFTGDHLNTWEDPKDPRFKGIDLKAFFKQHTALREELFNLRQKYINKFNELLTTPNANFIELGKEMTEATREWVAKYLKKSLPAGIHESEMAFISFGSMARNESGPITDLEGAIIWDKNIVGKDILSMVFAQKLANILDGLLGHPIYGVKGFRLDEAQNSPFHKAPFAKSFSAKDAYCWAVRSLANSNDSKDLAKFKKSYYYPFEGSWAYATTPKTLAEYTRSAAVNWPESFEIIVNDQVLNTPWYKWAKQFLTATPIKSSYIASVLTGSSCMKDKTQKMIESYAKKLSHRMEAIEINVIKEFPSLGRNSTLIYGNERLFKEFKDRRDAILDQNNGMLRKKTANALLNEIKRKQANEMTINKILPEVFDLKRQLYRFEEQLHANLRVLYKLDEQNQTDIIKKLVDMGIFGEDYGKRAISRQNMLTKMRWMEMILVNGQLPSKRNFLTKEAFDHKLKEINEEIAKNQAIISNKSSKAMDILMAKSAIMELKQDLKKMPILDPEAKNPIFTNKDIDYIKNILIKEQAETFRRLVAFIGTKNIAPLKTAFKDDFEWEKVDLQRYNIKQKK